MVERGTSWKAFLIQFIPAILGSGLLLSTILTSYSEFYNKPNIQVAIFRDDSEGTKTTLMISNKGTIPATNLKLHAIMPYNITEVNFFSMENISVQKAKSNVLEVAMPRLVQGEGSVTSINLAAKKQIPKEDEVYNVYSVYDQGSTRGKVYDSILDVERGEWSPVYFAILGLGITAFLVTYLVVLRQIVGRIYTKKVSRYMEQVFSDYVKSNKKNEDKIYALVKLQKIMNSLERQFVLRRSPL